ncbi:hypothetical protein DID88_000725 [Monilinia fructigena]|uniref:Reverse transcriptase n=2 Tax=Monilinia fructigena TaxID=38457 RepID=A0A395IIN4_9HELO|nr:hypothetical protein DID88_000725 [Monilinia fructigena]
MPLVMRAPGAPSGSSTQEATPPQPSTITPGASIAPPPIIGSLTGSALGAIKERFGRIDKTERERREVIEAFAVLADKLAQGFQGQQRNLAASIKSTIISALLGITKTTPDQGRKLATEQLHPINNTQKTYTDALKTQTRPEAASPTTGPTNTVHPAPSGSTNTERSEARRLKRENDRIEKTILIIAGGEALLSETSPFLLRLRIKKAVTGITLTEIPFLQRNNTGWTLRCSSSASREEIMKTENVERILKTLHATSMRRLEKWFMYAVPQVPHDFYHIEGAPAPMPTELIKEEITAQTGKQPINYRLARSGVNPITKRATWIVGFNTAVSRFRLFNSSSYSVLLDKPREIQLHSTGCLGYCNPFTCNRAPRCSTCGKLNTEHEGRLVHQQCTRAAQCANCHGPFRAGHSNCPAAPRVYAKRRIVLTAKELAAVRAVGRKDYEMLHRAGADEADHTPESPLPPRVTIAETPVTPGARITAYENERLSKRPRRLSTSLPIASTVLRTRPARSQNQRNLNILSMSSTIDEHTQGNKGLTIAWANVGRGHANHITLLQLAAEAQLDVICLQEPRLYWNSTTQNHNAYDRYQPIDNWNLRGDLEENEQGPRVMTYIRKGGDFNAKHELWEPGVIAVNQGAQLATWANEQDMEFIGTPGIPTHARGHVIDLTFSNIPFAYTEILEELHCGSDHATQVTSLANRGTTEWDQYHYRIKEADLPRLDGLMANQLAHLNNVDIQTTTEIETHVCELASALDRSIRVVGKIDRKAGKASPWWTDECREAHRAHIAAQRGTDSERKTNATHLLQRVVRQAKRSYWAMRLDGVKDDKELYRIMGWHKLTPESNAKSPSLIIGEREICDTREKAEALFTAVLDRFKADDDLPNDPLRNQVHKGTLPWKRTISAEEVEKHVIGASCTAPGVDRATVRLLKACWPSVKSLIREIFASCLALNYYPEGWKLAEVVMIPKVGKKDKTSPRSWRPIALISCIGKGLERYIASQISWTALRHKVISPQHCGALPRRSGTDLAAAFTHDAELALATGNVVSIVTMDVQGAFDALLKRRLLSRMIKQGWPTSLLKLIDSFLTNRKVRVRLEGITTEDYPVACGTPQGSPLSPILYMLYLAELLNRDTKFRFGYADDIAIYHSSKHLSTNARILQRRVRQIIRWGKENRILFAPEKFELLHITRQHDSTNPPLVVNPDLIITPVPIATSGSAQPTLRWLGVFFDRRLSFLQHVKTRTAKAMKVASHIRSIARTIHGPPASSLRKAVITCVLPVALFGTEVWYAGKHKPGLGQSDPSISAGIKGHLRCINRVINTAARGAIPVYKTTPIAALIKEAGLPSGIVALEHAKLRFALRLKTIDNQHLLVNRLKPLKPSKSGGDNSHPRTTRSFSDGSEQTIDRKHCVGYGYAIYRNGTQIASGFKQIRSDSHVFDAEAIGAWRGLEHLITTLKDSPNSRIWMCIDSTSVIWGIRGNAPPTTQWAFHKCHKAMKQLDIRIKWSPGHMEIEGNEEADRLANAGATGPMDQAIDKLPTISGVRTIVRQKRLYAETNWWEEMKTSLSAGYKEWSPKYNTKEPKELTLPRAVLHRLLAMKTGHGDYAAYHQRFDHQNNKLECSCGSAKEPYHFFKCTINNLKRSDWPLAPVEMQSNKQAITYIKKLIHTPSKLTQLITDSEFYTQICPNY